MPKYQLNVREYTDDPTCLKCLKKKDNGEGVDYYYDRVVQLFNMYCKRCGFRWWMEPAYTNWKEFDKDQGG